MGRFAVACSLCGCAESSASDAGIPDDAGVKDVVEEVVNYAGKEGPYGDCLPCKWPDAGCNRSIGNFYVCTTACKTVGDCYPVPGFQVACTTFGCILACTSDTQCPAGMLCRDTQWCRWP